jgi:hypothetical protein
MRPSSLVCYALCAPPILAFPWMTPEGFNNLLNHPEARQEINRRLKQVDKHQTSGHPQDHEARQLVAGLLDSVLDLLGGTVGALLDNLFGWVPTAQSVSGLKRFPEGIYVYSQILRQEVFLLPLWSNPVSANFPFQPPGPTDQRGPCPGLNTLANHGYIPRNGIATVGQINYATATVFNLGVELSTVLATGGALDGGDILSQTMSIGGPDSRVGLLNGTLNGIFGTPSGIAGHGKN